MNEHQETCECSIAYMRTISELESQIAALKEEKAHFYMQYRMDCDAETKEMEVEIADLKARCRYNETANSEQAKLLNKAIEERDDWQRQSSNNWNSAVQNGLLSASYQWRNAKLRDAISHALSHYSMRTGAVNFLHKALADTETKATKD